MFDSRTASAACTVVSQCSQGVLQTVVHDLSVQRLLHFMCINETAFLQS
jgi:hypothetical protein